MMSWIQVHASGLVTLWALLLATLTLRMWLSARSRWRIRDLAMARRFLNGHNRALEAIIAFELADDHDMAEQLVEIKREVLAFSRTILNEQLVKQMVENEKVTRIEMMRDGPRKMQSVLESAWRISPDLGSMVDLAVGTGMEFAFYRWPESDDSTKDKLSAVVSDKDKKEDAFEAAQNIDKERLLKAA